MAPCFSDGCVGKINTYIVWWDCLRTAALLHPEECWARLWLSASDRLRPERSSRLPPASLTAPPARGSGESQSWSHPLPKSWFGAAHVTSDVCRRWGSLPGMGLTYMKKYRRYQDGDGLPTSAVTSSNKLAGKRVQVQEQETLRLQASFHTKNKPVWKICHK